MEIVRNYTYHQHTVRLNLQGVAEEVRNAGPVSLDAWTVTIDDCELRCFHWDGVMLLALCPHAGVYRDIVSVHVGTATPLRPFTSGGFGRRVIARTKKEHAVVSVPFEYIKPYIDHCIAMRDVYSTEAVLAAADKHLSAKQSPA